MGLNIYTNHFKLLAVFTATGWLSVTHASTLAGFDNVTTAFCRETLQLLGGNDLGRFSHDFASWRGRVSQANPNADGKVSEAVLTALGVGTDTNNKLSFIKKFWWNEDQTLIKPKLRLADPAQAKWIKENGLMVPRHRGDMLFSGDQVDARLSVSIVDAHQAVTPMELSANPQLKRTATLDLTINDRGAKISEKSFREWAESLMADAQLQDVIVDRSRQKPNSRQSYYDIVTRELPDGSNNYSLRVRNVVLPFFRLTWLIEGTQRSLAPADYRQTRDEMERTLGVPAHRQGEAPLATTPFQNSKEFMRSTAMNDDLWAQVENLNRSSPAARDAADSRKDAGRKPRKTYDRKRAGADGS